MSDAPPPKLQAGEVISCSSGHQVGTVLNAVPLALSIRANDVALPDGVRASALSRYNVRCRQCGKPVANVDDQERWSVRLERGWVR
jgi:hypothetical protein